MTTSALLGLAAATGLQCFLSANAAQGTLPPGSDTIRETVSIHPKLPPFRFEIEGTGEEEVTIRIGGGPKTYRGQTIHAVVEDEKRPGFGVEDVNFDGYQDFYLVTSRGATGNVSYEYWTYDPRRGLFEDNAAFDEITHIDEEHRLLVSYSKGGNVETITKYFHLRRGVPVLFKSVKTTRSHEVRDVIPSNYPDQTPVKITRFFKNGKLRRTFYTAESF